MTKSDAEWHSKESFSVIVKVINSTLFHFIEQNSSVTETQFSCFKPNFFCCGYSFCWLLYINLF